MRVRAGILAALLMAGLGFGGSEFAAPVQAQDAVAESRFLLTIDQERLFTGSLFGERISAEIRQDLATLEQEFQRLEADLTAEEKDLTKKRPALTPDAFRLLADAFDEKVQGIRKAQDAKARTLDRRLEQERGRYYGLINPILHKMMLELGATVIIDGRAILVGGEGVDITEAALQRIDASLGDGATRPDQANE